MSALTNLSSYDQTSKVPCREGALGALPAEDLPYPWFLSVMLLLGVPIAPGLSIKPLGSVFLALTSVCVWRGHWTTLSWESLAGKWVSNSCLARIA